MNTRRIFPSFIILIQLISLGHLYHTYQYRDTQVPAALIELSILAVGNILVLVVAYFFYFRAVNKQTLWWIPVSVSTLVIGFTLICYLMMAADRYR